MEFVILKTKEWKQSKGCYPVRIVLTARVEDNLNIYHQNNANRYAWEYTTHQQINATEDKGKISLASGHYFMDLEEAIKDFKERY